MSVDLGDAKVTWALINWIAGGVTGAFAYLIILIRGKVGKEQFGEFKESIKDFKDENARQHTENADLIKSQDTKLDIIINNLTNDKK